MARLAIVMLACLGTMVVPALAEEGPLQFTRKPTAAQEGDKVRIEFTVDRQTDVAVFIEDARGKIVRHLAAGVLGKNAPEPLRKNSLAQSLVFDGKDDQGKPAAGGPFRVKVSLGLTPTFDKVIGIDPGALGSVRALATNQKGNLYVFHVVGALHPNDGTVVCSVFDREGKYLRMILPYPANLPEEKLRGLRRIELPDGRRVPFIYQGETRSLYPGVGDIHRQRPVVAADGRLAFVGIQECGRYANAGVNRVTVIHTDGGVPPEGVLGPQLGQNIYGAATLALSPDGEWLYATALYDGSSGTYWEKCKWHQVVYRCRWKAAQAKPLLGTLHEAGNDAKHFDDPMSLATDAEGRIYVADRGNDRIAVFASDGAYLSELKVEKPSQVEVHPRTGAIYVMAGTAPNVVVKFSHWRDAKEVARCDFRSRPRERRRHLWPLMALDSSADPPVVWIGAGWHSYGQFTLLRIEDRGQAFGAPADVGRPLKRTSVGAVTDLSLDRSGELLYTSSSRAYGQAFDGRTGKALNLAFPELARKLYGSGSVATIGLDGHFYFFYRTNNVTVSRYSPALQALPFAAEISDLGTSRLRGRGLTADRDGKVYLLWQKPKDKQTKGDARDANALAVYGADGKLINAKLIDSEIRSINSVRVDPAGNIYLAVGVRPAGKRVPDAFAGMDLGKPWKYGMNSNELNWYPLMYGSIVKFGPEGGEIRSGIGGTPVSYGYDNKSEVKGAQWIYFGASNVPSWRTKGTPDVCLCESPRFDVDDFGRSFFPDVCRFRIGVIDSAGNEICFFGSYGNQDCAGPEIALCWPHAVAVGDEAVYIGDRLNRRVVRVKLEYQAQGTVPIPTK